MSCHEIGPATGYAIQQVLNYYKKGKIKDKDAVIDLCSDLQHICNFCDGNASEIIYGLDKPICGMCLSDEKEVKSIYSIGFGNRNSELDRNLVKHTAIDYLCKECFTKVINNQKSSIEIENLWNEKY